MSTLTRIKDEILSGKNIFLYLTILLCFAAAIGSLVAANFATGVTMIVLSLLLENILEDRWNRNDSEKRSNRHTTWDDLRQEFRDRLRRAKTVSFLAVSPLDVLRTYNGELRRIVDYEGGRLRFLVVDPNQEAMDLIAVGRPENRNDGQIFLKELGNLTLHQRTPTDAQSASGATQVQLVSNVPPVQVRVLCGKYNYVPSCILSLVDDEENDGVIFVTVYSYRQSDPSRPSLKLTRADGVWYTFFQREFKDLWVSGEG